MIFTNYVVDIERDVKNKKESLPKEIEIRFTGGQVGDESLPNFEEVKSLEINQLYLLSLKKVFPENPNNNFYTIIGGEHQGLFKVELDNKKNITKINQFNEKNKIEKELTNKNIEELLKQK